MFFTLSKIAWWILSPLNLLILIQAAGLASIALRRRRIGLSLLASGAVCLIVIGLFPVSALLLQPLEQKVARPEKLPARIDGLLLLGGGQEARKTAAYGMVHMGEDAERLTAFTALARRYPDAKWVFSGGFGSLVDVPPLTESQVMQRFFEEQGLDAARLIVEDKSRNTHENALFTQALLKPAPGETWVLITSAYHMPRALAVFEKIGWKVIPFPVSYRSLPAGMEPIEPHPIGRFQQLEVAVHEWIGLAAYRLTGRI